MSRLCRYRAVPETQDFGVGNVVACFAYDVRFLTNRNKFGIAPPRNASSIVVDTSLYFVEILGASLWSMTCYPGHQRFATRPSRVGVAGLSSMPWRVEDLTPILDTENKPSLTRNICMVTVVSTG